VLTSRIEEGQVVIASTMADNGLAKIVYAEDVEAEWQTLDIEAKQNLIRGLLVGHNDDDERLSVLDRVTRWSSGWFITAWITR
jgi:hypothetical protein